jgi:GT2 family glycosyltransferase
MFNGKRVGVCVSSFVYDQVSLAQLKKCIGSLIVNSKLVDDIYITDDCSTYNMVWAYYSDLSHGKVRVVRNHRNRGIGAMKNLALRLLGKCDIKFLIDSDVSVRAGWDDFYCRGLLETQHSSVSLCNIFDDNQPFRREKIGTYQVNYHSKYQGAFMCFTQEALNRVGGFPLLPQRYGGEHYNWQVRMAKSLGMEPCVIDFDGSRRFVENDHRHNSFITAHEKEKQSSVNSRVSDAILKTGVISMPIEIDASGERGDGVAVIIPFRAASWSWQGADNGDRTANLLTVIDYYKSVLPNAEITVVEQDKEPVIESKLRGDVKYLFLKNKSTFNKCWAYNCAARATERPHLVFMDSDAILRPETVHFSVGQLQKFAVYKPYVKFLDLTAPLAIHFRNAMKFTWNDHTLGQRCAANDWFTGGCVMVRRKEYFEIGGFNEKFRGWGGEDDEFIARAMALVPAGKISGVNNNLYHLYHFVPKDSTPSHPMYDENLAELRRIGSLNNAQLVEYVKNELTPGMGNPAKYANE